jgi:hypothetical protein
MPEHWVRETPSASPLQPAYTALLDSHEQWHDAFDTYHDPKSFRRHIDTLIQSLRNVTFRLQEAKHAFPIDFDAWYGPWQDHMRSDSNMTWLRDARNEIVKSSGIQPSSYALVRVIDSFDEPDETLLRLPPTVSTQNLLDRARRQVPDDIQPFVAFEVMRRWSAPDAENQELLALLLRCFHVLDALLLDAGIALTRDPDSEHPPPGDVIESVAWPRCMIPLASLLPIMQEADTKKFITYSPRTIEKDEATAKVAEKRYGPPKTPPEDLPVDLLERAETMNDIARNVFKRDGFHYPFAHFRRTDGTWEIQSPIAFSKRDKFIMWHTYAAMALRDGYNGVIFTTEVWLAPFPEVPRPYESAEDSPDRKEFLVTYAEEASGRSIVISSEIYRLLGKPYLKRARVDRSPHPDSMIFFRPLRRVWQELASIDLGETTDGP